MSTRATARWLGAALALSAPARADVGTAGGLVLTQPPAARPASLGEAYAAEGGAADAAGFNPAGLGVMKTPELSALYHAGFSGDSLLSAAAGIPVPYGGIVLGGAHYNAGSVEKLLPTGDIVEISAQRDAVGAVAAGFAVPDTGFAFGAGGEVLHTELIEEIQGTRAAGSLGVRWAAPDWGLALGAAAQHLGKPLVLASDRVALPLTLRLAVSYEVTRLGFGSLPFGDAAPAGPGWHRFVLLGEVARRAREGETTLAAGAEYSLAGVVALRGGVRDLVRGTAARQRVYAAGAGFHVLAVRLDYAVEFLPFTALHRVSLAWAPRPPEEEP